MQGYTSAVRWFAAAYLLGQAGKTSWEQVSGQDIEQWMVQLLDRYSGAYASIQFRALRQFFKWLATEDQIPDPMDRLRAPRVAAREVPVFTSVELSALENTCRGSTFAARRDAAIIAVFTATGIRLSGLAGIRYHPGDPVRSDLDLHAREIRIAGKAGKPRTVRIGHQAARSLDRYLRARARHPQAWRPQLWLGVNSRGPLTPAGIYQIVTRRGRQCGVNVYPHRFRHHFSHTWLDRGGAERDLMELNGRTSPRCSPGTAPAPAAPAPAAATTASWTTPPDRGHRYPPHPFGLPTPKESEQLPEAIRRHTEPAITHHRILARQRLPNRRLRTVRCKRRAGAHISHSKTQTGPAHKGCAPSQVAERAVGPVAPEGATGLHCRLLRVPVVRVPLSMAQPGGEVRLASPDG